MAFGGAQDGHHLPHDHAQRVHASCHAEGSLNMRPGYKFEGSGFGVSMFRSRAQHCLGRSWRCLPQARSIVLLHWRLPACLHMLMHDSQPHHRCLMSHAYRRVELHTLCWQPGLRSNAVCAVEPSAALEHRLPHGHTQQYGFPASREACAQVRLLWGQVRRLCCKLAARLAPGSAPLEQHGTLLRWAAPAQLLPQSVARRTSRQHLVGPLT